MKKIYVFFYLILIIGYLDLFSSNKLNNKYRNYPQLEIVGEKFIERGEFQKALIYFKYGLVISSLLKNKKQEFYTRSKLGLIYWNIGEINNAEKQYNYLINNVDRNDRKIKFIIENCIEIINLYKKGKKYRQIGELEKSINLFQKAIRLSESIDNNSFKLKCMRHLGIAYWMKGNYQIFYNMNVEAILIAIELNNIKEIGNCFNHLGLFHWKTNGYSKSLFFYKRALLIANKQNNKKEESILLNNISIIYKELGDYNKSLSCLVKALFIELKLEDLHAISMILNNIGVTLKRKISIYEDQKSFIMALKYYWDALQLAHKTKNHETEIRILNNIGSIYQHLNEHEKSMNYFNKGLDGNLKLNSHSLEAMLLNNLGTTLLRMKDIKKAKEVFKKAITLCSSEENKEILWEAYYGLGKIYEIDCEYDKAEKYYKKAITLIDEIRIKINEDEGKIGFARNKQGIYETLIELKYNNNTEENRDRNNEIFCIIEKAKSRAFLESLIESEFKYNGNNEVSSNVNIGINYDEITSYFIELLNNKLDIEKKIELMGQIENGLNYFQPEKEKKHIYINNKPSSISDIQKYLLDKKTALIEYYLGERNSYMIYITKNTCHMKKLSSKENIVNSIKAYLNLLSNEPNRKYVEFSAGHRIYKEIFIPRYINIDAAIKHIIIIPDGVLNYFPFETLILGDRNGENKKEYLISKYSISYAPSASSLLYLIKRKNLSKSRKDILAVGVSNNLNNSKKKIKRELDVLYRNKGYDLSPLSYCEHEIKIINKIFKKFNKDIFINKYASEYLIKKYLLNKYSIIHFACHGLIDQNRPLRSALLFLSNNNYVDDGYLQAREVLKLELKSDLVVLSACQTGRGKLEKGEGVIGFPRVFLLAGSKSVISTLWKIEDKSSARFMKYFYLQIKKGESKSESLRKAKEMMLNTKYSHPFYWAAFVLHGEYSSAIEFK